MKRDIQLSETFEHVVRADVSDPRDWLAGAPACAALRQHGIVHVGHAEVEHPYEVKRPDLSGTFVMACTHGEGCLWLEGKWQPMRAGTACLAPPHTFHAYRARPRYSWRLAWVRYQEPEGALPFVHTRAPVLAAFDGRPLAAAIEGLFGETGGMASPAAMTLWVDLIQHYARTFAAPWQTDDRLRVVWQAVAADLAADWSLARLSSMAHLGPKQFSRLCQQTLGRTPAQHVTTLRLQTAVSLLTHTADKVEVIAQMVGYRSLFTFSRTFKQFSGHRPSEYRKSKLIRM